MRDGKERKAIARKLMSYIAVRICCWWCTADRAERIARTMTVVAKTAANTSNPKCSPPAEGNPATPGAIMAPTPMAGAAVTANQEGLAFAVFAHSRQDISRGVAEVRPRRDRVRRNPAPGASFDYLGGGSFKTGVPGMSRCLSAGVNSTVRIVPSGLKSNLSKLTERRKKVPLLTSLRW